ncbi:MAG: endopeptidase La [Myxococcota bacterium]|jgi:ATP-dependent Lon protease|nr:endopeptidase La [Myxococcota bacterium]
MTDSLFPSEGPPVLPLLPLRNSVLFPASVVPVNVGRPRSVRLVEEVVGDGADRPLIGVVGQRRPEVEDPSFEEIHHIGTVARILKVIRLSSGNYSVVLQGVSRMRVLDQVAKHPCLKAHVERIREIPSPDVEIEALAAHLRESARRLTAVLPNQPRDASSILDNVKEAGALADLVASNLPVGNDAKQTVLETLDVRERLRKVLELVNRQSEVYRVKKEISTMVEEEMSRTQREYLLRQQLRAIKRELGEPEDDEDELEGLREKLARLDIPQEAERAARKQLGRMRTMSSASSEYQVARSYVEWITDLPWTKTTPDRLDVGEARRVLDEDHHGLEQAKKRITEYIAVRKLRHDVRGPILCFVGPPGVGKTSLARSIARATGRQFVRVSLGGVQDEAEIRGHRRTYVGAFPGRIVGALKKAGSRNPVMLLDEIDKLGSDTRGDPGAALLEVLDPEQNDTFVDHYIEVPFDLQQVMFIATANTKDTIPGPLLDRMEVIDVAGYTREEKHAIARSFLVPRQLEEHGLSPERLDFEDAAVAKIIDEYTREAGVRKLEQQVASVCREVTVRLAAGEDVHVIASPAYVERVLGPPRYLPEEMERRPQAGVTAGLAWTPSGGDVLYVEARRMPGKGRVHLTGQMGDVMKESVATAFTYVRAHAEELGLPEDFLTKVDVHVHLPNGGVPKDGPSAGITVFTALASMFTRLKVRSDVAMTGEITLRGNVLRVGGIKEKLLAAHRAGMKRILLPKMNEPDLDEVPKEIRDSLEICLVSKASEVLPLALADVASA